jgi:thiol-disulfide isomerase/thioredoxin
MSGFINLNGKVQTPSSLSAGADNQGGLTSRFTGALSSLSTTTIMLILVTTVALVGISYYIYTTYSNSNTSYKANSEKRPIGSGDGSSEAELLFFYVDWCPHCKTAKPDWEDLKAQYENTTINGYSIIFTEINCTEETAEVEQMMNKYHIEGFPTIKLIKDGQVIEYDAKPTKDTLVQFLNTVL